MNTKGKRRTRYMFSRSFIKHGVLPLATYMGTYKKGDIRDIKGMDTVQKGMPHKCYHGKTGRVYGVNEHAVGIVVNSKLRARILPREWMCIVSIQSILRAETASWNVWRKLIRKWRKLKRKVPGFTWITSLLHPKNILSANEPSLWIHGIIDVKKLIKAPELQKKKKR